MQLELRQEQILECSLCHQALPDGFHLPLCKLEGEMRRANGNCPRCDQFVASMKESAVSSFIDGLLDEPYCRNFSSMRGVSSALYLLHLLGKTPRRIDIAEIRGIFDVGSAEYKWTQASDKWKLLGQLLDLGFTQSNLELAVIELLIHKGYPAKMAKEAVLEGGSLLGP